MLEKLKHPIVILLIKFALLYILWFLFYDVWLRSPHTMKTPDGIVTEQTSALDEWIIKTTTQVSVSVLSVLGNEVFYDGFRTLGIEGSGGLWVGDSCNAITLIALFAGLIICLSGIWWHKLIYIFAGSILIWLLNVLRLVFLAIIDTESRVLTEFNHTYTFTLLVYAVIIFLWFFWIKKFADLKSSSNGQKN